MKRKILVGLLAIMLLAGLVGCSSDKAWRRATVDSYEILGAGIGATKPTVEALRAANIITDEQLAKVKAIENKAKATYASAGSALKLASAAETEAKKELALQEYTKLLADFKKLLLEITDLINSFSTKKVSILEVQKWITEGGAL